MKKLLFLLLSSALLPVVAAACPPKDGIPDYNCDGKVVATFLGDSLVVGFGDTKNGNTGGYPLRISRKLPDITIHNDGVLGERTFELLQLLRDTFDRDQHPQILQHLSESDVVFIDVGRNDRWLFGEPSSAYRNIKRAASKIMSEVRALAGQPPLVVKAVIMLPNRGSQGPWVKALDELILRSNSANFPADLRFDLVSKRLLSDDQIHPTSAGYDALAKTLLNYLKKSIPKKMNSLRPDGDDDGISDLYETSTYMTDPAKADTDGDGKSDGDEVFKTNTNPLAAD